MEEQIDEIVICGKMAMDRTMYGNFDSSSAYQPYRLARKDLPAPGYALLADLATTVPNDNIKHVLSETFEYKKGEQVHGTGEQIIYENTKRTRSGNCPSELDTLLNDLNSARYSKGSLSGSTYGDRLSPGGDILDSLQRTSTAASSATQELDDLMASLSDIKVSDHQATPSGDYALPVKSPGRSDPLDSMLGNLTADMHKQGVLTTQKGCCNACEKPIVGQVVTALGRTWHPEHFTCAHCQKELGTKNFFERDGRPYCEPDYHNLFSPRCSYCNGAILDKCVTAMDRTWHPEHFFCVACGEPFGDSGYHDKDGKPYCKQDYYELFAPKCGGCQNPISDNYISALNAQWHAECFVCRDCRVPFAGGSFYDHEGQPYCETHYHAKRGSLCAGCHKPITGRCITAMFRKYHPEHFVCSFCLGQLNKGTFKEQGDKPYCHICFEKLYG